MLVAYGAVAAAATVAFFAVVGERPPTPPCLAGQEERSLVLDGLKGLLRKRDFVLQLVVFTVGLGLCTRLRESSLMKAGSDRAPSSVPTW